MTRYSLQQAICRELFGFEEAFPSKVSIQIFGGYAVEESVDPTLEITVVCVDMLNVVDAVYDEFSLRSDQLLEIQPKATGKALMAQMSIRTKNSARLYSA